MASIHGDDAAAFGLEALDDQTLDGARRAAAGMVRRARSDESRSESMERLRAIEAEQQHREAQRASTARGIEHVEGFSLDGLTDARLAGAIAQLEGWQDEKLPGTSSLAPSTLPADRNRRLERLAALRQERQRRLTSTELDADPRPFTEQVQDLARRGHIKALFGRWLEINAPELDTYLAAAAASELEQFIGELRTARTNDREFHGLILALRVRVAGELDGSVPAPRSAARPEHSARLASAVRERLLEMGAIRSAATATPAVPNPPPQPTPPRPKSGGRPKRSKTRLRDRVDRAKQLHAKRSGLSARAATQETASSASRVSELSGTRRRARRKRHPRVRSGPRQHVIRGKTRPQSIEQCAEVDRAHRADGLTIAELAERHQVTDSTIKRWIKWHDDDVAADRWPLNSGSEL